MSAMITELELVGNPEVGLEGVTGRLHQGFPFI